jgi:hypothetical protein
MKFEFEKLLRDIELNLTVVDYRSDQFVDIAKEILQRSDFQPNVSHLSESWCWTSSRQHYPKGEFSQFPLTLFAWENFHLDLYLWKKVSTSIHDHHFQGAFKVIQGDYCQTQYQFEEGVWLSDGVMKGKMMRSSTENITLDSVQSIFPRERFIHSVVHTQDVNLTLCLRTRDYDENLNVYLLPGYKITFSPITTIAIRKLDALWLQVVELETHPTFPAGLSVRDIFRFMENKLKTNNEFKAWCEYLISKDKSFAWQDLLSAYHKTKLLLN